MIEQTNEDHRVILQMIEAAKTRLNPHFDSHIHPWTFSEGDLVPLSDQDNDKIGKGKFDSMWYGPYVIHQCLGKGAHLLLESDDHLLKNPLNGIYLKRFYA